MLSPFKIDGVGGAVTLHIYLFECVQWGGWGCDIAYLFIRMRSMGWVGL